VQRHPRVGLRDLLEELEELLVAVTLEAGLGDLAGSDLERGEQRGRAVADVVMGLTLRAPIPMGRVGWVRSRAWTWLFSSTQSTTAFSGGCR
jgi:hypothetical protein